MQPAPIKYTDRASDSNDTKVNRIFNMLKEELFPEEAKKETLQAKMFSEIVRRSIADVSGNINNESQRHVNSDSKQKFRVTIGRVFESVRTALSSLGISDNNEVLDFFLGNASGYSKGIVQTPHPTEMLVKEAISKEEALVKFLEDESQGAGCLFTGNQTLGNLGTKRDELKKLLTNLFEEIVPVRKALTIDEEMERSVEFSERMFDAVPIVADRILSGSGVKSHELNEAQFTTLSHLVQPLTWSPGDQDSKPDMTVEQLEHGYALNRRRMMKHYADKILGMAEKSEIFLQTSTESIPVCDAIADIVLNCYETAKAYDGTHKNEPLTKYLDYVWPKLNGKESESKYISLKSAVGRRAALRESEQHALKPPKSYEEPSQLLNDLFALRDLDAKTMKRLQTIDVNHSDNASITAIDKIIIQAENFGVNALSPQIRQNQDVHSAVFDHIIQETIPSTPGSATDKINHILSSPLELQKVQEFVRTELERIEQEGREHQDYHKNKKIANDLDEVETKALQDKARIQGKTEDEIEKICVKRHEKDFYFYQTLKSLEFATRHPDFIPQYLIAECGGPEEGKPRDAQDGAEDILKAFLLKKVMEPDEAERKAKNIGLVEIVPLVEHPYQVMETDGKIPYVEMMKQVFENPYFKEETKQITQAQYQHLVNHTTVEDGKIMTKPVTGTDILATVNPEFGNKYCNLKDNNAPVHMAKLCMGAGSDVTKFGGVAAAGLMQNAMHRLKEELASLKDPVYIIDYIGCGGGVHRTQPVSSSVETQQGRSMRQTPDAIATKAVALLARNMRDRLASDPRFQLDLSNIDLSKLNYKRSLVTDDVLSEKETIPTYSLEAQSFATAALHRNPALRSLKSENLELLAQLNLGNLANLPRNPDIWNKHTRDILQRATQNYINFIATPEFNHLMSYTSDMFCKLTSFAARPANRVSGGEAKEETFPPIVAKDKLRAIGFGGALNASGSMASLYLGVAESIANILTEEERTSLTLEEVKTASLKKMRDCYLREPNFQDMINRATYGVLMSDMDAAWKYLGESKVPDQAKLEEYLYAPVDSNQPERLLSAKKALAHITLERNLLINKLTELHMVVCGKAPAGKGREGLLSVLPEALADQIDSSYHNIKLPRHALAATFQQLMKNNGQLDQAVAIGEDLPKDLAEEIRGISAKKMDRYIYEEQPYPKPQNYEAKPKLDADGKEMLTEEYKNIIYPAMGAIFECTEHAPRAFTSPHWGYNQSKEQSEVLAA